MCMTLPVNPERITIGLSVGGRPDQVIRPQRAIVTLDDRITYTDDDWPRLWVQENGS